MKNMKLKTTFLFFVSILDVYCKVYSVQCTLIEAVDLLYSYCTVYQIYYVNNRHITVHTAVAIEYLETTLQKAFFIFSKKFYKYWDTLQGGDFFLLK